MHLKVLNSTIYIPDYLATSLRKWLRSCKGNDEVFTHRNVMIKSVDISSITYLCGSVLCHIDALNRCNYKMTSTTGKSTKVFLNRDRFKFHCRRKKRRHARSFLQIIKVIVIALTPNMFALSWRISICFHFIWEGTLEAQNR